MHDDPLADLSLGEIQASENRKEGASRNRWTSSVNDSTTLNTPTMSAGPMPCSASMSNRIAHANTQLVVMASRSLCRVSCKPLAAQTSESIAFIFNPGAVELMAEGAKDFHSLPLADRMKFDSVNQQMMTRFESLFIHYRLGLLTEGQWAAKRTTLGIMTEKNDAFRMGAKP